MSWLLFIMAAWSAISTELLQERFLCGQLARHDLVTFCRLVRPDPNEHLNVRKSRFEVRPHHALVARALQEIEAGKCDRLIIVMPRRHGKTELAVHSFIPWWQGRHPEKFVLMATYSDTHAQERGRAVRDIMRTPGYRLAFGKPESQLRGDSQACDRLQLAGGGITGFVGRDSAITGRGADLFVVDDPIKNEEEAQSQLIRDHLWTWFNTVVENSFNTDSGAMVLIQTRWSEDDLVGRLTDPKNPHYDPVAAARWKILHLRALSRGPKEDPLGREKDESLWPARLSAETYKNKRNHKSIVVRTSFQTMDQGEPTPETGTYFLRTWVDENAYDSPAKLPRELRNYVTSDHALTTEQQNDATVLLPFGVDHQHHIWVYPDVMWFRYESPDIVDAMLVMMRKYRPLRWWAEREHISKAILPFLRLRQKKENVYGWIEESPAVAHPEVRAWSIKGAFSMGMVHLPSFAPWYADAVSELIKFPRGLHDDFVSALTHAGMGLDKIMAAEKPSETKTGQQQMTLAYVKGIAQRTEQQERREKSNKGW